MANLRRCVTSLTDLCSGLTPLQWQTPSLCPEWTVHGVLAHLAGIEFALAGWRPEGDTPAPFHKVGEFVAGEAAGLSGARLLARFREIWAVRDAELAAATADDFAAQSWTPVGVATYGRFMDVRVFDFWVHEQDIRVPLGLPGHLTGPSASQAFDEVRKSWGYILGKRVGLKEGQSVTVEVTGPIVATLHGKVDGRAQLVDHLANADATVTMDSLTFLLLCCGRIDPQEAISQGKVGFAGDLALGEQVARNLRFTF